MRVSLRKYSICTGKGYCLFAYSGFYFSLPIIFLSFTGLIWSFDWWANGFYTLLEAGKKNKTVVHTAWKTSKKSEYLNKELADHLLDECMDRRESWQKIVISFPNKPHDVESKYYVFVSFNDHSAWEESDQFVYNNSGDLQEALSQEQKGLANKWEDSNYAFHTGSIYGLPTKILMFLATLFCVSLPVTGFIIWYNRNYGKKRKSKIK